MASRVVVTGMGAVTALGNTLEATWSALLRHESGVRPLNEVTERLGVDLSTMERFCSTAAAVQGFEQDRTIARSSQFAIEATRQALQHAKLLDDESKLNIPAVSVGVAVGTGMGHLQDIGSKIGPHFVPRLLPNAAASRLGLTFGCQGPTIVDSSACAAASHALGLAAQQLRLKRAQCMIVCGTEAALHPLGMEGFGRLRALSSSGVNRPFDEKRDGFVMGEGAACLILETQKHAECRGVEPLALVSGYGASADAYHLTAPDPSGQGAKRALSMALEEAGPCDVDYVNAHATGTLLGDVMEAQVVAEMLGSETMISSTKAATGHLLGAAGALEAVLTIQMLRTGEVLPSQNLETPLESINLDYIHGGVRNQKIDRAISNSFGFGGTNASLVFDKV